MKTNNFIVYFRNEDWSQKVCDEEIVLCKHRSFELDEVLELIAKRVKVERGRYGYDVYTKSEAGNEVTFIRFGNVTTRKNDTVENFVRKNWEG